MKKGRFFTGGPHFINKDRDKKKGGKIGRSSDTDEGATFGEERVEPPWIEYSREIDGALNAENIALDNAYYECVIKTTQYQQWVAYSVTPLGTGTMNYDQGETTILVVWGAGFLRVGRTSPRKICDGALEVIHPGMNFELWSGAYPPSRKDPDADTMKLLMVYSPPKCERGRMQRYSPRQTEKATPPWKLKNGGGGDRNESDKDGENDGNGVDDNNKESKDGDNDDNNDGNCVHYYGRSCNYNYNYDSSGNKSVNSVSVSNSNSSSFPVSPRSSSPVVKEEERDSPSDPEVTSMSSPFGSRENLLLSMLDDVGSSVKRKEKKFCITPPSTPPRLVVSADTSSRGEKRGNGSRRFSQTSKALTERSHKHPKGQSGGDSPSPCGDKDSG